MTDDAHSDQPDLFEIQAAPPMLEAPPTPSAEAEETEPPPQRKRKPLAEEIEPLLETLFRQGQANMATMSPAVVACAVLKLERILIAHGVLPDTRRANDPKAHAKAFRARQARAWAKATKARGALTPPVPADREGAR
jgi:hypothetical protein